jgi:hypothetical protein
VKYGLFTAFAAPDGWMNTTVEANPAPAFDPPASGEFYSTLTFTLPTLDTHGGTSLQIGDYLWVQTCTPGVDPPGPSYPCDTINGHHLSTGPVVSIDTTTRVVKVSKLFGEESGGNHLPVVGGAVYMGSTYTWGAPSVSRQILKAQISDPAELAAVVAGTMNPWEPSYEEEFDLTLLGITQFGCPVGCRTPGVASFVENHGVAPIPDAAARQLMISAANARTSIGIQNNAVYVFDVAH